MPHKHTHTHTLPVVVGNDGGQRPDAYPVAHEVHLLAQVVLHPKEHTEVVRVRLQDSTESLESSGLKCYEN